MNKVSELKKKKNSFLSMTSAVIYDNDKYIYTLQTLKPRSEKHFVLRTSVKLDMVAHTGI